jgi:hypothetical protein
MVSCLGQPDSRRAMHFWANDDAIKLAQGLRAALGKMANANN